MYFFIIEGANFLFFFALLLNFRSFKLLASECLVCRLVDRMRGNKLGGGRQVRSLQRKVIKSCTLIYVLQSYRCIGINTADFIGLFY